MNWWHRALVGVVGFFGVSILLSLLRGEYQDAGFLLLITFVLLGSWMVLEIVFEKRSGG